MKKYLFAALCVGFISGRTWAAQAPSWELQGGSNAFFAVETNGSPDSSDTSTATHFNLFGTYGYFLTPNWEPQVSLSTTVVTGDSAHVYVTPLAGMAYNFGDDTENAVYFGGRIGPQFRKYSSGTGHTYTLFAYNVFLGKRFRLADRISWAPEVSFSGHTSGSASDSNGVTYHLGFYREWAFTPFQIALVF